MESRLRRSLLGGFTQGLRGEPVILLVQCQLGRGEIGIHEIGGSLDDGVVELVEHLLWIGATDEQETPEGHLCFWRGILPRRAGNMLLDRTLRLSLAVGEAVEPTDVATD